MNTDELNLMVSIYLRGYDLDPKVVSKIVGIEPSRQQIKGGLCYDSTRVTAKIGVWALFSNSNSSTLEEHLKELLEKLGTCPVALSKIQGVEEAYLDIFCTPDEGASLEISIVNYWLEIIVRLGLDIHYSV